LSGGRYVHLKLTAPESVTVLPAPTAVIMPLKLHQAQALLTETRGPPASSQATAAGAEARLPNASSDAGAPEPLARISSRPA